MFLCSCSGGCCSEAEHKLFSVIFSNYNQYIRPVENVTDPVIVQFEVSMSQLVKVVSGPSRLVLLKPKIKNKASGFEQKSFRKCREIALGWGCRAAICAARIRLELSAV